MRYLKAFAAFCYDLLVGDDWRIAVSVVISLALTALLLTLTATGDHVLSVVGAALVMASFALSVVADARERGRSARSDGDRVG